MNPTTEKHIRYIIEQIYREMYEAAYPEDSDYDKAMKMEKEEHRNHGAYQLHYLSKMVEEEIIVEHTQHLDDVWADRVKSTVILGAAPMSNVEKVNENRLQENLEPIKIEEE